MKAAAIVYTSNTGTTAQYAQLLAQETGLPVYSSPEAKGALPVQSEIIYFGWLMAGSIQGYKAAAKKYRICAVCAVGMGQTGSQLEDARKSNAIPSGIPIFTLQGGFHMERLRGIYRFMMQIMAKTFGKKLENKAERTAEEDDMLDLLLHGGSRVSAEHLKSVLDWYSAPQ